MRALGGVGKIIGGIFCVTLLISTITGGNMFQAWNVGEITENYFPVPSDRVRHHPRGRGRHPSSSAASSASAAVAGKLVPAHVRDLPARRGRS